MWDTNKDLKRKYRRFVSVTLSYYDEIELSSEAEEEQINKVFEEKIRKQDFPKKVDFDEIIILNE